MRKLGIVLMGLGVFLLVTAALVKFYMVGAMTKTPLDTDSVTYLSGEAEKFDAKTGKPEPLTVGAVNYTQVDGPKSDGNVVSWVQSTCVVNLDLHDKTECLDDKDPATVALSTEYFATDRVSGLAVKDPAKYVPETTGPTPTGLMNKFPFHTEKKTYSFWDGTLGAATDMVYDGTETIDGYEVYRFKQTIKDEPIEIQEGIPGTYSLDKTVWVEPVTGSPVNQEQHDVRLFENGDTAIDLNLAFTDEQVKKSMKTAGEGGKQLTMLGTTIPLVALIAGLLSLGLGFVLSSRKKKA